MRSSMGEFFRFQWREQLRSGLFWMFVLVFGLLAFGLMASEALTVTGGAGGVYKNSPSAVLTSLGVMGLLALLAVAAIASHAMLSDFELGTADLVFAHPIRKRDYLMGRLLAALAASLLVYAVIVLGFIIGEHMPWLDQARLGPTPWKAYAWGFGVLVIPNLIFAVGMLSFFAVVTRSILWVYIGLLGFIVAWGVTSTLAADLDNEWIVTLLDPLAGRALSRTMRYWATEQRNTLVPAFGGYILANRVLWTAVGLAFIAAAFALFKTERTGTGKGWRRRNALAATASPAASAAPGQRVAPRVQPTFGTATSWRQWLHSVRFDTRGVLLSVPFLVMLAFGLANFIPALFMGRAMFGTPLHPVTSQVADLLQGAYSWLLVIVAVFYAGELAGKARAARIHEVTDAMPVRDWVPIAAKLAALVAVIVVFQAIGALAGIAYQAAKGMPIEPLTWLKILANGSLFFILMGMLALAVQGITHNKFAGYAVVILVMVGQGVLASMDLDHNLYNIGSAPNAPWSDMNGYGHFLKGQWAFQGYWLLFMLALLLLATALWVRGTTPDRNERWRIARARLRGTPGIVLATVVAAFVGMGAWLFWNTNILNTYRSADSRRDLAQRYERDYKQYERILQPKIEAVQVEVDLQPTQQTMRARGQYRIFNPGSVPITDVHVMIDEDALVSLDMGGQSLVKHDAPLDYRIYRLNKPLQPGERRQMTFAVDYHPRGITNGQAQTQYVANGTFFNNAVFPSFGYDAGRELNDRNERRKRGMGEPSRMPKLEDVAARQATYLTDDADWIDYRATICTDPDQVALSPGYLKREFTRDGRRCFDYAMDEPMLNFYSVLSGRWQVAKGDYKGKPIEIHHHPAHAWNVQRMIDSVRKSMAYYEASFSPYQFKQLRIIEFPRYASFAQSFANTVPYSEGIGFIADNTDPEALDYVFYVTAHEVAHQWWGHQVAGAASQGGPVLVESLAQYSALMVMEREYGKPRMRQFLKYELDRYLAGRGSEQLDELPLYRSENQGYIHYQKGSLVFYRLRDEIGEGALNRALAKLLKDRAFGQPPYPTTLDLLRYIRAEAPADKQALITDLFEKITLYDNRVTEAKASKRADGKYDVTLTLHAAKLYADGKGKETPAPMDEWVEIGVFADGPSGKERDEKVLYLQRYRIDRANPVITVTVAGKPDTAGFDPYNKLIDRVSSDNRKSVTLQ